MPKTKLNYRFHNPNTAAATAEYIMTIFLESNKKKVDAAIRAAAKEHAADNHTHSHDDR